MSGAELVTFILVLATWQVVTIGVVGLLDAWGTRRARAHIDAVAQATRAAIAQTFKESQEDIEVMLTRLAHRWSQTITRLDQPVDPRARDLHHRRNGDAEETR
jgi:hypothetical protein